MRNEVIIAIVAATIAILLLLILILFLASIIRRGYNERKYRKLDSLREFYGNILRAALEAGDLSRAELECTTPVNSSAWQAVEDTLLDLIVNERYQRGAEQLLSRLGYISYHEKWLASRHVHARSLSIDKLGRMKSRSSVPKLIPLLSEKNPEIVSVTVRSLSKIGGSESLQALVEQLPVLLEKSIVARKTIHTAILAFGADAVAPLVERSDGQYDPRVVSSILEILSRLPADARSAKMAAGRLSSSDAEVRSKALKVLGRAEKDQSALKLSGLILPLLQDPVWFVRLQALRSAGVMQCGAAGPVEKLVHDQNWQVRNEAAQALIMLGECSLDMILEVLSGTDDYAKDSIYEEIEKTGFSARLIENLGRTDEALQKKSRQILEKMCSRGFSATLEAYPNRRGIESILRSNRGMKIPEPHP